MTPPITHVPKSNMAAKAKSGKKMGRRPTPGRVHLQTYSFTYEPPEMVVIDKFCAKHSITRTALVKRGITLAVLELENETSS